jgi:hypothetical protein
MNATSIEPLTNLDEARQTGQKTLMFARRLDTIGRQTEQFLCDQLGQLERAIDEFESEKAAWRRQYCRESQELARQREEIQRLMESNASGLQTNSGTGLPVARTKEAAAEKDARKSGTDPLRFLIQAGNATSMQVGLLLFEISKLNRDMGGRGLRFEIDDIRAPRKGLLSRLTRTEGGSQILELTVFPTVPLSARGVHVSLDVEETDHLEDWITFKSQLLKSSLVNTDLAEVFRSSKSIKNQKTRNTVKEAVNSAESKRTAQGQQNDFSGTTRWATSAIDAIRQQAARLENCYEQLSLDCGLLMHIGIPSRPVEKSEK